ncbi:MULTISPECIES: hypothetical protein [Mycetohabitans]|nr:MULTISPECIES: hypothetical protein [Mycetohabitans]MCG1048366.1 hypothetical protein [Mycetohabitans sp. B6]
MAAAREGTRRNLHARHTLGRECGLLEHWQGAPGIGGGAGGAVRGAAAAWPWVWEGSWLALGSTDTGF